MGLLARIPTPLSMSDYKVLRGVEQGHLLTKILEAVDRGVSTEEIRKDPLRYITTSSTKEIVINTGGEGLKLSPEIVAEMARRQDPWAKEVVAGDHYSKYNTYATEMGAEIPLYAYLRRPDHKPDRTNATLIEIIKEKKLGNNGGMRLEVLRVRDDPKAYKVRRNDDHWGSEYVEGWQEFVACLPGWPRSSRPTPKVESPTS